MQLDIFADPAIEARDAYIERVEGGCPVDVLHDLHEAARGVAERMQWFTTDDIMDAAGRTPKEPRVWGAVMLWAQKQGFCLPTGDYRQSRRKECHARPKMVWRSMIYKGTT